MKLRDLLNEYTEYDFKVPSTKPANGDELKIVKKLLPSSIKTARAANTNAKIMQGKGIPIFIHVAYFRTTVDGQEYFIHQKQYYNSNYKDLKGVTKLFVQIEAEKSPTGKDIDLGTYLVTTDSAQKDFKRLR